MSFGDVSFFRCPATLTLVAFPRSIFDEQAAYFASARLPNGRIDHGMVQR